MSGGVLNYNGTTLIDHGTLNNFVSATLVVGSDSCLTSGPLATIVNDGLIELGAGSTFVIDSGSTFTISAPGRLPWLRGFVGQLRHAE